MRATKPIKRSTLRELTRLLRVCKQDGYVEEVQDEINAACHALALQAYGRDFAWLSFCDIAFAVMGWFPLKPDCTDEEFEELFRWLGFEIEEGEYGKYIDREAFLEHMKKTDRYFAVKYDIENFPSADIDRPTKSQFKRMAAQMDYAPVVHGRWEWFDEDAGIPLTGYEREWGWRCSCCGEELPDDHDDPDDSPTFRSCSNCGAKMGGTDGE